ncbi:MAG: hypothetical protein H6534_05140 [Chthonomonadaceae bacterium]|nr:hypothetical protein [Chthonomonadaceae bacterium]
MKRTLAVCFAVAAVAASHAQSRSSFNIVTNVTGLTAVQSGLDWTLSLDAGATMDYNGHTYTVQDVFGFWLLDDDDDFSATGANQHNWGFNSNYAGTGGIAGWSNPSKSDAITGGSSLTFTFATTTGAFEAVGYHVRFTENIGTTGANTLHVTEDSLTPPVPEPFTMTLGAAGLGLAAWRRRRK